MRRSHPRKYRHSPYDFNDATIMLVFIVFVVLVIFFFDSSKSLQGAEPSVFELRKENEMLLSKLVIDHASENGQAIIVGNVVNAAMLSKVANTNYEQLKRLFGMDADFVIYFEDEEGNIVAVGEKPCIGSGYAYFNGRKCSE